ncbi:MAG: hypothetical protein J5584_05350 [Clostridia bacterium]|nr:hypothetical protein [Clostridia bacterium]
MDTQINQRGFWQKVNRGALLLLALAVAAVVFVVFMRIEESRIEKSAARVIDDYNRTHLVDAAGNVNAEAGSRNYYEYDVSYQSLDRIAVNARYISNYTASGDYFELKREGGSWRVVFCKYNSTSYYGADNELALCDTGAERR